MKYGASNEGSSEGSDGGGGGLIVVLCRVLSDEGSGDVIRGMSR